MQTLLLRLFLQFFIILGISLGLVTIYPVFMIGCYLWKKLAIKCGKYRGISLISPVSGISAFISPDKLFKNPNCTLVPLAVLESTPDLDTVTRHLQSIYDLVDEEATVRKYAKLGYSLEPWWGYLFWKEIPNFEIQNQITFIHNKGLNPENVSAFVEGIIRQPFHKGKPLWEIFIVTSCPEMASSEEREGTECFAIFRTHHILFDGMSLVKFWHAADSVDEEDDVSKNHHQEINYGTSLLKTQAKTTRNFLQRFISGLKMHFKSAYLSNKYLCNKRDDNVLMNVGYKKLDGKWFCSGLLKIHLERYRQPLRDLGFSLSHALLVGYGRGLKKFIRENYGVHHLPRAVHIMGSIPRPPYPDEALTNHWTIMRYKADFTAETLLQELEHSRTEYKRAVHHIIPEAFERMHSLGMDHIPYKLYDVVWDTTKSGTLSLSNIPGSTKAQKMFGIEVTDRAIWLPLTRNNSGIGLLMLTYNGWATISITADSGCIRTRKLFNRLTTCIMSEMQFLLDEVLRMSQEQEGLREVSGQNVDNHNMCKPCCSQDEESSTELHEIKVV